MCLRNKECGGSLVSTLVSAPLTPGTCHEAERFHSESPSLSVSAGGWSLRRPTLYYSVLPDRLKTIPHRPSALSVWSQSSSILVALCFIIPSGGCLQFTPISADRRNVWPALLQTSIQTRAMASKIRLQSQYSTVLNSILPVAVQCITKLHFSRLLAVVQWITALHYTPLRVVVQCNELGIVSLSCSDPLSEVCDCMQSERCRAGASSLVYSSVL